tara:strand:+ start:918 stop:1088 length:171 start_codon:yes stop_codon:yes gene_type:complete
MSYRVLMLGYLVPAGQYNIFGVQNKIVYDPRRQPSVAYADRYYMANLTCGHQLTCF